MEKIADRIEQLLLNKLDLYQKLQNILEEEKNYVVSMDVNSLWATTSKKKSLISSIEDIRQAISCLSGDTYLNLKTESQPFDLLPVLNTLTVLPEKKAKLKKIAHAINTFKKEIRLRASENKKFINEYLTVIDGIFSTVSDNKNKNGYNPFGSSMKNNDIHCFIHSEV